MKLLIAPCAAILLSGCAGYSEVLPLESAFKQINTSLDNLDYETLGSRGLVPAELELSFAIISRKPWRKEAEFGVIPLRVFGFPLAWMETDSSNTLTIRFRNPNFPMSPSKPDTDVPDAEAPDLEAPE